MADFAACLVAMVIPRLRVREVVVMDNVAIHRVRANVAILGAARVTVSYPTSYSPALNLIENARSKVKGILRSIGARTRTALAPTIPRALLAVTPRTFAARIGTVDTVNATERCRERVFAYNGLT